MLNRPVDDGLLALLNKRGIQNVDASRVVATSCLSVSRLKAMVAAADAVGGLAGDTAEVGCGAGGTSRLMALLGKRRHWVCDTFDGLVDVCKKDGHLTNGMFHNLLDDVKGRLSDLDSLQFVKGYFPQSAPDEMRDQTFALVHIDVDTYASIKACFDFFRLRMAKGGIIVIDDVIGRGTPGAKVAWNEILAERPRHKPHWDVIEQNDPAVVVRFA